jgi:hypothetical protein
MRVLLLLGAVLLAILAWMFFNPDYREQIRDLGADAGITKKTVTVYKWRNPKGEWQITDHLPPEGTGYERLDYHQDQNVLPLPPQLGGE